jgi:hypothetical protein
MEETNSIKVSFIYWLGLLFQFGVVFQWNLWDFSEINCWTKTRGHQHVTKNFGLFVGSFFEGLGSCGR